jgi:hypothetical protein
MQQQLISHSPDLKRLQDEGYEIAVDGAYLFTHHLPYLNSDKCVQYGTLVCLLTLATPTRAGIPQDHTIYFKGATPCDADGKALIAIINQSHTQQLTNTITVDHFFSSKPPSGNYPDFYEKISTYAKILGAQAQSIDSTVTWKPLKTIKL